MNQRLILCGMIFAALLGCDRTSTRPHINGGCSVIQLEPNGTIPTDTTVNYVSSDGYVILAIWSDWGGSSASSSSDKPDLIDFSGAIDRKGQSVKWIGAANAVGDGKVNIADTEYDLANGYFFLVTQRDGVLSVKQSKRDRTRSSVFRDYVQKLSAENEVGRFFGTTDGPDSGKIN